MTDFSLISMHYSSELRTYAMKNQALFLVGVIPWTASPGKACGAALSDICDSSEVRKTGTSASVNGHN